MNLIQNSPETAEKEVLEQVAYQSALYLGLDNDMFRDCETLSQILEAAENNKDAITDQASLDGLRSIIGENGSYPELGEAEIVLRSWTDKGGSFDVKGFQGCAFELNGERSVCFRGTPAGAWVDNGYGMAGGDYLVQYKNGDISLGVSPMQKNALEFMQIVLDDTNANTPINISGHSKGGNETQLAALVFADRITAAYNFDGQGFPPDVVQQLQSLPGWEDGLKKIYAIHADNDYVHGLGQTITLPENTVFLYTPDIGGFLPGTGSENPLVNHFISALITEDGHLQRQTIEGPFARGISDISDKIMGIEDPETRAHICLAIMAILQKVQGKEDPINEDKDWLGILGENGLKLLVDALGYPQTYALLAQLSNEPSRKALLHEFLSSDIIQHLIIGQSDLDCQLSDHDFETEEQIAEYLKRHTEDGKCEYLVRGALLRCRHGTHARQLNLKKCHGVYIKGHPYIHALNCFVGEEENITWYGVCKAPCPPPTETIHLTKDVPRSPTTGAPTGTAPGGFVSGHKCSPEIVGAIWMDSYELTRIVDNGDIDPSDRAKVQSLTSNFSELTDEEQIAQSTQPDGIPTTTTLSFLICKYGD